MAGEPAGGPALVGSRGSLVPPQSASSVVVVVVATVAAVETPRTVAGGVSE